MTPVIFFDIGQTLATARRDANGRLIGFTVLPGVIAALEGLRARSLRMGIISNRGSIPANTVIRELDRARLRNFFDPHLIIFAVKNSPAPFAAAAATAGEPAANCFFVGENNKERSHALTAGYAKAIPDPALVLDVLDGGALFFASVSPPAGTAPETENDVWSTAFSNPALLPLRVSKTPRRVEVLSTTAALARLRELEFQVQELGKEDDPQTADLYLIRDDRSVPAGFVSPAAFSTSVLAASGSQDLVVGSAGEGLIIALPAGTNIEQLHFPNALHGHNDRLIPDRSLLAALTNTSMSSRLVADSALVSSFATPALEALRGITPAVMQQIHERYIGVAPLAPAQAPVDSRHIEHADNQRVTDALVDHLAQAGGNGIVVTRYPFKYQGLRLENIEAELPGQLTDSFVLITAHLDSTAKSGAGGFNPASDPAPGSDDDASGIAAVVAAARALAGLQAKRSIRFVLFNAEEQGLVGSKEYARAQAAQGVDIAAVFQMDMIGFRQPGAPLSRNFEVHTGFFEAPLIEERSLALAQMVNDAVAQVSPCLNPPQIFPDIPGAADPADGRSDHSPFQQRGYAACVTCEDFFVGPKPDSPEAQPNPNYHTGLDKQIDYEYAANIARAVTAAAWKAANA
ncbi:MAG TPA: M20/M25/M40 family metallo-hydrolase [Pyrinomonadaceae bacterium]|nr:M20/M25/M40 family metallo-hydrolase [Pyrinomonadaceae bacterium]